MRIKPEDLHGVRNDSGLTPEQVADRLAPENSVDISYGGFGLRIERHVLEEARQEVRSLTPAQRRRSMASINRALTKGIPKLRSGNFSKGKADLLVQDLILWHALKELSE